MPLPSFPVEIEDMIFLQMPRPEAYTCIMVNKRIKFMLERNLYCTVCLSTESKARRFLHDSISHRPAFAQSTVKALCLCMPVRLETASKILAVCRGIESLNMRFPCHLFGQNPILRRLPDLNRLDALYIDLSSIFNTRTVYLPDVPIFHRVTHLHLSNAWATWDPAGPAIGLHLLQQITHLSLYLSTIRTVPSLLTDILASQNLVVLILWKRANATDAEVSNFFVDANIEDKRVIVLSDSLFTHHMLEDAFWASMEHLVKARLESGTSAPANYVVTLEAHPASSLQHDVGLIDTDMSMSSSDEDETDASGGSDEDENEVSDDFDEDETDVSGNSKEDPNLGDLSDHESRDED